MPNFAFPLEIKTVTEKGLFEGLASVYGNIDEGGDVVEPGAFTKTLAASKERPLLWQHRDPVGTVTLTDSVTGLKAAGKLSLGIQLGKEALVLLRDGVIKGLSIGFETVRSDYIGDVRHLHELKLWEISLVTIPMNQAATVTAIKSADLLSIKSALDELRSGVLGCLQR